MTGYMLDNVGSILGLSLLDHIKVISFCGGKAAGAWSWPLIHLVPRFRIHGAIPPIPMNLYYVVIKDRTVYLLPLFCIYLSEPGLRMHGVYICTPIHLYSLVLRNRENFTLDFDILVHQVGSIWELSACLVPSSTPVHAVDPLQLSLLDLTL